MELRKHRWSKTYEAAEVDLGELLESKGIEAERWTAEGDQEFELHMHPLDKRLWCAEGSIMLTINSTQKIAMQAGDALTIPAYMPHSAVAGFAGCVCYESPLMAQNESIKAS
jgi:quercetin dioxygenase-like cupin family protein